MNNKDAVSEKLSWGLNCSEIAAELVLHPVTVRRLEVELRRDYWQQFYGVKEE